MKNIFLCFLLFMFFGCGKFKKDEKTLSGVWYSINNDKDYIEFSIIQKDTLFVYICDSICKTLQSQLYSFEIKKDSIYVATMNSKGKDFNKILYNSKIFDLNETSFLINDFWVKGEKLEFFKIESVGILEDYYLANEYPILPLIRRTMVFSRKFKLDFWEVRNELENSLVKHNWEIAQPKLEDSIILIEPIDY